MAGNEHFDYEGDYPFQLSNRERVSQYESSDSRLHDRKCYTRNKRGNRPQSYIGKRNNTSHHRESL